MPKDNSLNTDNNNGRQAGTEASAEYADLAFDYYRRRLGSCFKDEFLSEIRRKLVNFKIGTKSPQLVASWIALPSKTGLNTKGLLVVAKYFHRNYKKKSAAQSEFWCNHNNLTFGAQQLFDDAVLKASLGRIIRRRCSVKSEIEETIEAEISNAASRRFTWTVDKNRTREEIIAEHLWTTICPDNLSREDSNSILQGIIDDVQKSYGAGGSTDQSEEDSEVLDFRQHLGVNTIGIGCPSIKKAYKNDYDRSRDRPRDFVVTNGVTAVVYPNQPSFTVASVRAAFFDPTSERGENYSRPKRGFCEIDLPARLALQSVNHSLHDKDDKRIAVLLLLPVSLGKGACTPNALLSMILAWPMIRDDEGKSEGLFYIGQEHLKNFVETMRLPVTKFSKAVEVRDSLETLSHSYQARPDIIGTLFSQFERKEFEDAEEDNTDQGKYIYKLWRDLIAAPRSPIQAPLDAICRSIAGAMYSLVADAGWEKIVDGMIRFAEQERLSIGEKGHRDHYLHTFKVFLLGRRLLLKSGKKSRTYDTFIQQRWTLAAFFHDVCYPIQETSQWLDKYLRLLAPKGVSAIVDTSEIIANWKSKNYECCWFDVLLQLVELRVEKWFKPCNGGNNKVARRVQATSIYGLIAERNHAVVGAFALLHQYLENGGAHVAIRAQDLLHPCSNNSGISKEISVLFDAATAILLHDPKVWEAIAGGRRFHIEGLKGEERSVAATVWALSISDSIQEWGRDVDLQGGSSDWRIPWHSMIDYVETDGQTPSVTISLTYRAELEENFSTIVAIGKYILEGIPTSQTGLHPDIGRSKRMIAEHLRGELGGRHSEDQEWSEIASELSYAAAMSDLLAGKSVVRSRSWALSYLRCFPDCDGTSAIREWLKGDRNSNDKTVKLVHDWGDTVHHTIQELQKPGSIDGRISPEGVMELIKDIERMAGFWLIPWRAFIFWNQPSTVRICLKRRCIDCPSMSTDRNGFLDLPTNASEIQKDIDEIDISQLIIDEG